MELMTMYLEKKQANFPRSVECMYRLMDLYCCKSNKMDPWCCMIPLQRAFAQLKKAIQMAEHSCFPHQYPQIFQKDLHQAMIIDLKHLERANRKWFFLVHHTLAHPLELVSLQIDSETECPIGFMLDAPGIECTCTAAWTAELDVINDG